jgi:CyaY protein
MSNESLPEIEYHRLASAALAAIETQVDRWLDDDVIDIDIHRTGGLLELTFPNHSKIILNMQPPLQEIWLAAKGGGFHYRWREGSWRDGRDGTELWPVLSKHAAEQANTPLIFQAPD